MSTARALSSAFYRHPAFMPHRLLRWLGIKAFCWASALLTALAGISFLLGSAADNSLTLSGHGYGFLEHPGIFGWFVIQLALPIAIQRTLKEAIRARRSYYRLSKVHDDLGFRESLLDPLVLFIGLRTECSRALYSLLFTLGFSGFAWTMYQNLWPGRLAPLDFWDSINFFWGYGIACIYKFYMHALLLPSVLHIFAGIVWYNASFLRKLVQEKSIRILPFSSDHCGGIGFLSDLALSPTITALILSGLAFFGVVYTHRTLDISTAMGIIVQLGVLTIFYGIPTALLRGAIKRLKHVEVSEINERQKKYYIDISEGRLRGQALRDAHEYALYLDEIVKKIDSIPLWPHLYKVFGALGLAITPALTLSSLNLLTQGYRIFLGQP